MARTASAALAQAHGLGARAAALGGAVTAGDRGKDDEQASQQRRHGKEDGQERREKAMISAGRMMTSGAISEAM